MQVVYSVTGHRPNKLYNAYPEREGYKLLVSYAEYVLKQHKEEIDVVLTGMALGWDIAIAETCRNLGIKFVACIPFPTQYNNWPRRTQQFYMNIIKSAYHQVCVSEGEYSPLKMQIRNEYMVNYSKRQLALWNGTSGGTANCVKYAEKKRIEVINCWEGYVAGLNFIGVKL